MAWLRLYLACFALHFLLLLGISCRETLALVAGGYTMLPPSFIPFAQQTRDLFAAATGESTSRVNLVHQLVATYTNFAGIEAGYGYFAPNVPDSYKLVFELHYPDGRVEYDAAGLDQPEGNLRLSGYLDEVGNTSSTGMREIMVKLLVTSVWRKHPEATMVRAILGEVVLPTPDEYAAGVGNRDEFLAAYDFSLTPSD